ncbi:hypothetical protein MMC13_001900 [Lambiella insularis]|nr:hypothetical protein [Lambiella insularis]
MPQAQPMRPGTGSSGSRSTGSRVRDSGIQLDFEWHLPFISKKEKNHVTLVNPLLPPVHIVQDLPSALRPQSPYPQVRPASWGPQQVLSPLPNSPTVITVEPRTPDQGHDPNDARPRVHFPTRNHERRHHPRSPSPIRRNHSRGRLTRVEERLARLQDELTEARQLARHERTERLLAQIREEQAIQIAETAAYERWQEREESHLQHERERRQRQERDAVRTVQVHQTQEESFEDRGSRVLSQAMRDRVNREMDRRAVSRSVERRPEGSGLRRRGTHRGEEIVWDDDRERRGRRWH